jgi:hypothetical protein
MDGSPAKESRLSNFPQLIFCGRKKTLAGNPARVFY